MLHIPPTNLLLLAAKQEPHKKASLLVKNTEEFSGKSLGKWARRQKNKEVVKWNKMTALIFYIRGRHQTRQK